MMLEVGFILLLLLINGFFAMAELAVVSASLPRLEALAAAGDRGAKKAMELARDPGRLLRAVIAAGARDGVLQPEEQRMIHGVMRLADRRATAMMTPRPAIEWIDLEESRDAIRYKILKTRHSRLPVARGSLERMQGILSTREVLESQLRGSHRARRQGPGPAPRQPPRTLRTRASATRSATSAAISVS